jgi:hypothetical protein
VSEREVPKEELLREDDLPEGYGSPETQVLSTPPQGEGDPGGVEGGETLGENPAEVQGAGVDAQEDAAPKKKRASKPKAKAAAAEAVGEGETTPDEA